MQEKHRFWNFTRGERIAVILLLAAIAVVLGIRYGISRKTPQISYESYDAEVTEFIKGVTEKSKERNHTDKEGVSKKKKDKKSKKAYIVPRQSTDSVEREIRSL